MDHPKFFCGYGTGISARAGNPYAAFASDLPSDATGTSAAAALCFVRGSRRAELRINANSDVTCINAASGGLSRPIDASAIPTASTPSVPAKFHQIIRRVHRAIATASATSSPGYTNYKQRPESKSPRSLRGGRARVSSRA